MAKKKYKVQGTKDFLIGTIACAVICIWAVRDGWFPSNKSLKSHPPELALSFDASGVVLRVDALEGGPGTPGTSMARLATATAENKLRTVEQEYAEARDQGDKDLAASKLKELQGLQRQIASADLRVAEAYQIELDENGVPHIAAAIHDKRDAGYKNAYKPEHAVVKKILTKVNRRVAAGEPVVVLDTKDHFYPFNKVLAVIMGIGMAVFGFLHVLASKD